LSDDFFFIEKLISAVAKVYQNSKKAS